MRIVITLSPDGGLNIASEPGNRPFMTLDVLRKAADAMLAMLAQQEASRGGAQPAITGDIPPGLAQQILNGR